MRPYLNDYIRTLSKPREVRVSALLEEARVGKERLDDTLRRLEEISNDSVGDISFGREVGDSIISPGNTITNMQEMIDHVNEMYELSNMISLLLNSHSAVLGSEIKEIEDELLAMEKMSANFAFLLSDNKTYDFAYLESFSDDRNRDTELLFIPDRSGVPFSDSTMAYVDTEEGVLTLPENNFSEYHLTPELIKSNAAANVLNDTGIRNISNDNNGWRMDIATAGPVTTFLPEADGDHTGVQTIIELRLDRESTVSQIKMVPNADMPVDVLQITLFSGEDEGTSFRVLEEPARLDRPIAFHFPMQSVTKFHILLNQPSYNKLIRDENKREYQYAQLVKEINNNRTTGVTRDVSESIRRGERSIQNAILGRSYGSRSLPISSLRNDRGPANSEQLANSTRYRRIKAWRTGNSSRAQIIYDTLSKFETDINAVVRNNESEEFNSTASSEINYRIVPISLDSALESGLDYYYSIGLKRVAVGTHSPEFKAAFVSKPPPSSGDMGEVRLKVSDDNYRIVVGDLTVRHMTSVEYSVSNLSNPERESDWIPIQPIDITTVEGERLFLDERGSAFFRFEALSENTIAIYRNGYPVDLSLNAVMLGSPGGIKGVRINLSSVSPTDILTANYTPVGDPTVINFDTAGFQDPPLVHSYDATGPGEHYFSTLDKNSITLMHEPYIDPVLAARGGYQPIVVQLDNGEIAINFTNYQSGNNAPLPESGYYYIQSGGVLMFNRPIRQPFRVYYQYLQNNVRIRTVLRCNAHEFVSPKVDYIHLKAKTRRPDVSRL